jgi:Fibronectin type III domain
VATTDRHDAGQAGRKKRSKGALVTIGVVVGLVAAMGLTVLGLGVADDAVANYDASSWLWSSTKSEMARVNGVTSRVDTRLQVPSAQGHPMQVTQTDRYLILRDVTTGQISAIDLATLQVAATTETARGIGVSVALYKDAAFVIDPVQGVVRQLDPRSLAPIGEPVRYPPGITGGVFDGDGRLWIGVPTEGTVSAVTPAPLPSGDAAGGAGGGLSPERVQTLDVAPPSHDLALSALDNGVAILDKTTSTLTTYRGGQQLPVPLDLAGPGEMPNRTNGAEVPVTVVDDRHVYVVDGTAVHEFTVPGEGAQLRPAVAWSGRLYVADDATGTVYVLDTSGKLVSTIVVKGANGPLELEVRETYLFINAPNSPEARVVDDKNQVRPVDKFANDILGGDPPKDPPPPPPPPRKPRVGPPGAPKNVVATAGNATARVSWQPAPANGAAISKYVVAADGKTYDVGANQRSVEVTGLTNGQTYRFTVHAVNAKGAGPKRTSNPVVPSAEVPDPPASVTATENKDGTVTVSWPAANGQGHAITKYAVTAVSAGANAPAGESTGTELVIPAGTLEYGQQYAFTVVAVNDKGTGSKASPVSNSVVPYTVPGKPQALDAATVGDQKGAIRVTWQAAADNGRPITRYVVSGGGKSQDVTDGTSATLTGFGDGQNVSVTVHAVNEAGDGQEATATAKTLAKPTLTVTGSSADYTSVTVSFSVNAGGGTATCSMKAGTKTGSGSCSSQTVEGLVAGTSYTATITASNAAGSVTANRSQATPALYGVATCHNGESGDTATYCNADVPGRNGNEIFSVTSQDNNKQVGWARPGTRLKAYCKKQGDEIYAYIYNNDKRSTWWIQVEYEGRNYIPFAWLNLENGDDINALANC